MTIQVGGVRFTQDGKIEGSLVDVSNEAISLLNPEKMAFFGGKLGSILLPTVVCEDYSNFARWSFQIPQGTPAGEYGFSFRVSDGNEIYLIESDGPVIVESSSEPTGESEMQTITPASIAVGRFYATAYRIHGTNLTTMHSLHLTRVRGTGPQTVQVTTNSILPASLVIRAQGAAILAAGSQYLLVGQDGHGNQIHALQRLTITQDE